SPRLHRSAQGMALPVGQGSDRIEEQDWRHYILRYAYCCCLDIFGKIGSANGNVANTGCQWIDGVTPCGARNISRNGCAPLDADRHRCSCIHSAADGLLGGLDRHVPLVDGETGESEVGAAYRPGRESGCLAGAADITVKHADNPCIRWRRGIGCAGPVSFAELVIEGMPGRER